jgi:hypothetical protein
VCGMVIDGPLTVTAPCTPPLQASCIDSTAPAEAVFASEVQKMKGEKMKPLEQLTLEPYERDHAVVTGVYRSARHGPFKGWGWESFPAMLCLARAKPTPFFSFAAGQRQKPSSWLPPDHNRGGVRSQERQQPCLSPAALRGSCNTTLGAPATVPPSQGEPSIRFYARTSVRQLAKLFVTS